jgi:hypothetical protein
MDGRTKVHGEGDMSFSVFYAHKPLNQEGEGCILNARPRHSLFLAWFFSRVGLEYE